MICSVAAGPAHADDPMHSDELRIDLDPTPGTDFDDARVVAALAHALLDLADVLGRRGDAENAAATAARAADPVDRRP